MEKNISVYFEKMKLMKAMITHIPGAGQMEGARIAVLDGHKKPRKKSRHLQPQESHPYGYFFLAFYAYIACYHGTGVSARMLVDVPILQITRPHTLLP
jgi:hypothetical protein